MRMLLIAEKRSSSDKYDFLRFVRNNGSTSAAQMPRQGILPHDLIHFVVESALPLRHGFLSQVARGADAEYVVRQVHSYDQATVDIEAAQVEAIVEGLQTQLWAGDFDNETFMAAAEAACAARGKPAYDLSGIDVRTSLYERALALFRQWQETPFHKSLSLDFHPRPV
ncbi:hypothetical protein [Pseudoduganella rivuli]|nr:hypothetical protein [Pseudoduganella rivuli]